MLKSSNDMEIVISRQQRDRESLEHVTANDAYLVTPCQRPPLNGSSPVKRDEKPEVMKKHDKRDGRR